MAILPDVLRPASARLRARKESRERERYVLRQKLYREYPDLPRLDAALRSTMAEVAELALDRGADRETRLEEIRARNLALQEERTALLAQAGYGPGALDDAPACPRCRDTGWVGGRICPCLKELCIQEQLRQLSSVLDLENQTFDKARLDLYSDRPWPNMTKSPRLNMTNVLKVCECYAAQFPDYPLQNLLLSGNTGLGKTFLSACIAGTVARRGYSVVYDTAIHVFALFDARRFARDAGQEQAAQEAVERCLRCDLLILDDLGSETTTSLVQSALYELVNARLRPEYRTIISTNLFSESIRARYTAQIASRLEGSFRELTFYGEDIRLKDVRK